MGHPAFFSAGGFREGVDNVHFAAGDAPSVGLIISHSSQRRAWMDRSVENGATGNNVVTKGEDYPFGLIPFSAI